jgi:hypothetical protein
MDIVRAVFTWAADPAAPPGWDTFAQYSVIGVAVLGLALLFYRIFMQLWVRSSTELAREVTRADRLEAENRALNLAMQDKALPALMAAATALTQCTELLRDLQRERDNALRRRERDGDPR